MLGAWRTVLEHRFPDRHLQNVRAVPGYWEADNPPEIQQVAGSFITSAVYAANFYGDKSAQYRLQQPVTDIIGLDVAVGVEFSKPIDPGYNPALLLQRNDTLFGVPDVFRLGLSNNQLEATLLGTATRWDMGNFINSRGMILWRWLATGQSELYVNNSLVAFRNDVAPGQTLQIDRLYLGGYLPNAHSPLGWIYYARCNVTRYQDADVAIGIRLDIAPEDLAKLKKCVSPRRIRTLHKVVTKFMSQFLAVNSRNWQFSGKPGHPYNRSAVQTHKLAVELAGLLMRRLTQDTGNDKGILEKMRKF